MSTTKKNPAAAAAGTEEKKRTVRKPAARKAAAGKSQLMACVKVLLNLREGPGYDRMVIRTLQEGEKLLMSGEISNGFAAVMTQQQEHGWVSTDYIEVAESV